MKTIILQLLKSNLNVTILYRFHGEICPFWKFKIQSEIKTKKSPLLRKQDKTGFMTATGKAEQCVRQ